MHVGDRTKETIDAGGVLAEFTGVLVRDGYAGYEHLTATPAWCGAHYADLVVMPTWSWKSLHEAVSGWRGRHNQEPARTARRASEVR
jgi:hypothetical protein